MEVSIANIKGGLQRRRLNEFTTECLDRIRLKKRVGSHVIQRKQSDIHTTVLYFDIDKFDGDIQNHLNDLKTYLSEYYDDLDHLVLKSTGFNKYHIYFVNIIVSEATLGAIVRNFNRKCGYELLDKACIKNFIRMEGSTKFNPKTRKYVKNSQYEIWNCEMDWLEIYNKIYIFNKVETATKQPISTIKQEKKISNNTKLTSSQSHSNVSPELNKLLCDEFGEFQWQFETDKNNVKLVSNDVECLVDSNYKHSSINHSCIFINKHGCSFATCHSHGKRTIPVSDNICKIKAILGLVKQKEREMNDFEILCERVLNDSKERRLKKLDGYVYEPQTYSPIVFKRKLTYQQYLNKLFSNKSDKTYFIFRKAVGNMDKMIKYMTDYNDVECGFLEPNRHIFSFSNGYLDISNLFDLKFTTWDNLPSEHNIATTIHFNIDFKLKWLKGVGLETPIFDQIVNNHLIDFEKDNDNMLYNIFCGMIGRLHYDTNQYDRFNCMLFLLGYANTGKSTIAEFVLSNHASYGNIEGNEKQFGLQSCYNKPLAFNGDVRIDFHKQMPKSQLQKCIEGAKIDVPIKNQASINDHVWTAPLFFVSNFPLGYKDTSNAIPRRLCIFTFDNFIKTRDASLRKKMFGTERPLLLIKSLLKYRSLLKLHENKTFEDWPYKYFKDNTLKQQTKSDFVYSYCNLAPREFKTWPIYDEGCEIPVDKFKQFIERYVYLKHTKNYHYTHNKNTIKSLGYDCKTVKLCGWCGERPTGKRKKENYCCEKYNKKDRRNLPLILNMRILKVNCNNEIASAWPKEKCEFDYETDSD